MSGDDSSSSSSSNGGANNAGDASAPFPAPETLADASGRRRSWWGWGYDDAMPDDAEVQHTIRRFAPILGRRADSVAPRAPRPFSEVEPSFPASRVSLQSGPAAAQKRLGEICSTTPIVRAAHAYGRNYGDIVRGFRGEYPHPPDVVAYPESEADLLMLLEWCSEQRYAAIPYGGGTSVVGGVEPDVGDGYGGRVTIDLARLGRVLEVDETSRAARIQAGMIGPVLENALRPHNLTMRHFPQSFEMSSLGGWIATRAGGHYATLHTHIDDFVESLRVITPRGALETRRLPGSGAGPSPDRMFIGSEGALGIITEAWMRLTPRPRFRAKAAALFNKFELAVEATRAVSQSGLHPSNCRLLDQAEAFAARAAKDGSSVLLLGFESAEHPVDAWLERAVRIAEAHGARIERSEVSSSSDEGEDFGAGALPAAEHARDKGAARAWREAFLRAPYLLNTAVSIGAVADTFETAITWDRFEEFHDTIVRRVGKALGEIAGGGFVMCRFTHVYPDGPAPYYTFIAPASEGDELAVWRDIRHAAAETVVEAGGTITHHHAVGRLHRPYYDIQRAALFADALRAAKGALDPAGVLNPGVLLDPQH